MIYSMIWNIICKKERKKWRTDPCWKVHELERQNAKCKSLVMEDHTSYGSVHMKGPEEANLKRPTLELGRAEGGMRSDPNGYRVSLGGDKNALKFIGMAVKLCEYTKMHRFLHFEWMSYLITWIISNYVNYYSSIKLLSFNENSFFF